jgi:2-dehydropantoate 2-reductase
LKIGVVGAGAMGCLFAGKLSRAGNEVLLVDHDTKTVSAIRRHGVRVREGTRLRRVPVEVEKAPRDFRGFDLVVVMVKAYSTKEVARELRGRIGTGSMVLSLQNGLGNAEVLSQELARRVLAGSTTEASLRLGPGLIEHTGKGLTLVGEANGKRSRRALQVVQLLKSAGFASQATDSVKNVVWSKAVMNSAINPFSALTRLRNGDLRRASGVRELMHAVLEEGVRVATAEGVTLSLTHLSRLLSKVLRSSAQNRSSMLQDVLSGRKTEVRELNGIIARLGRRHRIATPLNDVLLSLVVSLEESYGGT